MWAMQKSQEWFHTVRLRHSSFQLTKLSEDNLKARQVLITRDTDLLISRLDNINQYDCNESN